MDIIIEDNLLYREKKKWIKRLCKLARTNTFSDSVKLLVYTAEDSRSKRVHWKQCTPLLSKHVIYGHLHGVHVGSQSHVMYIVCKSTVECLAFEDFDTMKLWSDMLGKHFRDISQFVDLVYADKHSQLKSKIEGRLFFNCSHISFIRSPSSCEPKLLMSWKIADVMEYGCRNADTKNSSKGKSRNAFIDESQSQFIMKVSPICQRAPNTHIFSCNDPKQFCNWMENLASNQENVLARRGSELMSQRLRQDSYSTLQRSRNNSGSPQDCDSNYDSPGVKSLRFFPETVCQPTRTHRFQRSTSEIRQGRTRLHSDNGIQENDELELNEQNVSFLCQSDGAQTALNPESPTRSDTVTWLERYPYERERGRSAQVFRRQKSEEAHTTNYFSNTAPRPIELSLHRPRSSSNYCSLLNLRQRNDSLTESLPQHQVSVSSTNHGLMVGNHRQSHEPPSPQYVNLSTDTLQYEFHSIDPAPAYVNIELRELVNEISEHFKNDPYAVSTMPI